MSQSLKNIYIHMEVLVHAIMFNCFQSVEVKESGCSFSDNFHQFKFEQE